MAEILEYKCEKCGYSFNWNDFLLVYRKDGEIVENPCLFQSSYDYWKSNLHAKVFLTYCDSCGKKIKIYTIDNQFEENDKKRSIEEVKEYLKHIKPKNTIKTFIEEFEGKKISCPKCNKEIPLDYKFNKCPKCGTEYKNICCIMAD